MSAVEEKYFAEHGTVTGAKSWLAEGLGTTRQNLDRIRKTGRFPAGYLEKIAQFTGLRVPQLLGDPADFVADLSRKWRVSIREAELILIWIALDHLDRN